MFCSLCLEPKKVAVRVVEGQGFCKEHEEQAFEITRKQTYQLLNGQRFRFNVQRPKHVNVDRPTFNYSGSLRH